MNVKCISDQYLVYPKKGEIYKAEKEYKGMYYIRDDDGELYAYPVSHFEIVNQ